MALNLAIPIHDQIHTYAHCGLCLDQKVGQKLEVGFTSLGLQVWCAFHRVNVLHLNFEGRDLPFNDHADAGGSVGIVQRRN
jgi:hypothetical protein